MNKAKIRWILALLGVAMRYSGKLQAVYLRSVSCTVAQQDLRRNVGLMVAYWNTPGERAKSKPNKLSAVVGELNKLLDACLREVATRRGVVMGNKCFWPNMVTAPTREQAFIEVIGSSDQTKLTKLPI